MQSGPGRLTEALALGAVERALGLYTLNRLYRQWASSTHTDEPFAAAALSALRIAFDVDAADVARIPPSGGLIVASNHPHGALDGLVLACLLARRRSDVKLLGNYLLSRIPEMRESCIFVDPFGEPSAARRNASGLREALDWVGAGGVLVVFPAGEVAHQPRWGASVRESAWHSGVTRLAERAATPILPVHIGGSNSRLFHWAGLAHPLARTALLARELLQKRGSRVAVRVGEAIAWDRLSGMRTAAARAEYLRFRSLGLAAHMSDATSATSHAVGAGVGPRSTSRVSAAGRSVLKALPEPAEQLAREVEALDASCVLLEHGGYRVVWARSAQVPHVMREIGRLREAAFHAVGEGTGRAHDLDNFDDHYQHLFVWHADQRAVAGAYRIGATDVVALGTQVTRLYTRSLFTYDRRLLDSLGPALELGRSFVAPVYQRDYLPLLLLWKGIGHLVAKAPRYRMLFGPVTISRAYSDASRELIARCLSQPRYRSAMASLVSLPRSLGPTSRAAISSANQNAPSRAATRLNGRVSQPNHPDRPSGGLPQTTEELQQWLSEIEPDGKGLPVLLRQYLRLNGKLLGFSVDPKFADALDGLMVVDLAEVDGATLQRYMGKDGAERWLAHQRVAAPAVVAPRAAEAVV